MERSEILEKVYEAIVDQLSCDVDDLSEDTTFEDLDADSLDMIEIVTALEDAFSTSIPDEELEQITTVGEAVTAIAKQL